MSAPGSGGGWAGANVISVLGEAWTTASRVLRVQVAMSFPLLVARGLVPGIGAIHKFGKLPDIDSEGPLVVWGGTKGPYLGFTATGGEAITVKAASGTADAGSLLSSGTATSGTTTTLVDTGATFVTDTVAVGDIVINDTQSDHGIITAIAETTATVARWRHGTTPAASDAYRMVTAASTGAAVVRVQKLLDSAYSESVEYLILAHTTGVDTTGTDFIRNSRARVVLAGSGGANATVLTATQKTSTGVIFWTIPVGYNSTMVACDTIPAGKTGYFTEWGAGVLGGNNGNLEVRLVAAPIGEPAQVLEEVSVKAAGTSMFERNYEIPKNALPAMTDIFIDATSTTANLSASGFFTLLLVDD